jgi:hypothetical protein
MLEATVAKLWCKKQFPQVAVIERVAVIRAIAFPFS